MPQVRTLLLTLKEDLAFQKRRIHTPENHFLSIGQSNNSNSRGHYQHKKKNSIEQLLTSARKQLISN